MDYAISILVFLTVIAIGGAVLAARRARQKPVEDRLAEIVEPPPLPSEDPAEPPRMVGVLSLMGRLTGSVKPSQKLSEELARAGYHNANAAKNYLAIKTVLFTGALALAAPALLMAGASLSMSVAAAALTAATLYFVPNIIVSAHSRKRCQEVRSHLPEALDLLEICVSSGMGMDTAWNAVAEEIRHVCPILSDEMALTNLEIHLGAARADALRHMATRTGGQDISSLVAIMVQSERFGTSIATALQTFAASMRQTRSQRAEERAEKMAVKLIIPMVLFIFPAVMVVLVGPAGIALSKVFKNF